MKVCRPNSTNIVNKKTTSILIIAFSTFMFWKTFNTPLSTIITKKAVQIPPLATYPERKSMHQDQEKELLREYSFDMLKVRRYV